MNPKPTPIYVRPPIPTLKWYTFAKRSGRKLLIKVTVVLARYDLTGESSKQQEVDT
jgi:hypothetical protein